MMYTQYILILNNTRLFTIPPFLANPKGRRYKITCDLQIGFLCGCMYAKGGIARDILCFIWKYVETTSANIRRLADGCVLASTSRD